MAEQNQTSISTAVLAIASLLIGFALLQVSNALQGTLLSVRAGIEGFGSTETGLVMSGFSAGLVVGSLFASTLVGRVGHIRAFAAMASIASASALAHLVFITPLSWILVRAITGFSFAILIVVVESWLNAGVSSNMRGRLLSIYAMTGMAAGAVGQLLLQIADPAEFMLFVIVSILMSLALVPVALSRAVAPPPDPDAPRPSIRTLWTTSPFGCLAPFLTGATIGVFLGLAPLFSANIGFDQSEIALLMAGATIGGLLLQYPAGWLSDRVDRRSVAVGMASVAALGCAGMATLDALSLAPSLALAVLIGGLLLPTHSLIVAHVNDRAPKGAGVATSGALIIMNGSGAVAGPLVGGFAMDIFGPRGLLFTLAAIQAGIVLIGVWRIFSRDDATPLEKGEFAPSPLTPVDGQFEQA